MKYIYILFMVNYKKNVYEPFAIAQTKIWGIQRVKRFNKNINKAEEDFLQLVRVCTENGGYFNDGEIIKIEE